MSVTLPYAVNPLAPAFVPILATPVTLINPDGSAGSGSGSILGSVGIDQTTPGVTNGVVATGNVASGSVDSGAPVKIGGTVSIYAAGTLVPGTRNDMLITQDGDVRVSPIFANAATDASSNTLGFMRENAGNARVLATAGSIFNGTSWDRQRGNVDLAALVTLTAQGAGTLNSADQVNYNGRGVQVGVNLTTVTTATVTVHIQGKDPSGTYYDILVSTAIATSGFTNLTLYPGAAVTANLSGNAPLPRTWRVQVVVVGASAAATGTVNASVIV